VKFVGNFIDGCESGVEGTLGTARKFFKKGKTKKIKEIERKN
jgi:hypothetical protein